MRKRPPGFHQIESLKLNLKENEIIRSDIPFKSNLDTVNIISLDTDFISKGGIKELTKWVKEILLEHGNGIYMTNTIQNDKIRSVSKQIFDTILGNMEKELEKPDYKPMRM